ncbi:MAG: FAD-dependent oxidoreductase [Lachnospiraceae bacterium]|nr:FAD-dependent oxidoreductase [Lachnospiraceae bacterium]
MLRINGLKSKLSYTDADLRASVIKALHIKDTELFSFALVKRSIDARDKDDIHYVLSINAQVKDEARVLADKRVKNVSRAEEVKYRDPVDKLSAEVLSDVSKTADDSMLSGSGSLGTPYGRPVIVGFGPAGMICAYKLAEAGLKPIVIERGLDVDSRKRRVEEFWGGASLDANTNVQFGEGGAGTFSDGKLSTMIHDKAGRIVEFFRILVENGADESIMYNAKPHVGTDRLAVIVKNIRNRITELGGEVRFASRLKDIAFDSDGRVCGVVVEKIDHGTGTFQAGSNKGEIKNRYDFEFEKENSSEYTIETGTLVLAIGHSARDTFEMLHGKGFVMEQKPFAVGVRVQHPQDLIGRSQYGKLYRQLPPADYKLTYHSERLDRGVYSFCMCPGGFVVNASSEPGKLAVNGMSNSDRGEATANSAIVVNVDGRDFAGDEWNAGIEFQRRMEERAFNECGGKIPAQRYGEFIEPGNVSDIASGWLPNTKGAWGYGNIHNILPAEICEAIKEAFPDFGHKIRGFDDKDTLLMGVESRTSSPVRILRNEAGLEAAGMRGVYPSGEGAGYAGGITSAAVDGIKVYEAIVSAAIKS